MNKQKTLNGSFSLFGKGLHTGLSLTVTFNPAPENHGYKIQRIDLPGEPIIDAIAENVTETTRGTVLTKGEARVSTVEHAMAALFASGIDNCLMQVNGPEFPILDGSAIHYIENIERIGIKEQNAEKDTFVIKSKIEIKDEKTGSSIIILPDENFSLNVLVHYNVAIDSDDLVLVGSHMAVVIGTYARRGGGNGSVNWKKLMGERKMYHVSWSEYLLILQFVLAKKHTVNHAIDTMIEVAMKAKSGTDKELIGKSAKSVLAMSRKVMQLDVIKHAKFPSHKVMYDRTAKRLGVEDDFARLHEMFSMMNDNLQGLSDYEAVKSDSMMNNLLIAISVVSIFELVFQEDELPFVERFFNADLGWLTAVMSMLCAVLAVIALGTLFWRTKFCKKIVKLFKTNG